MPRFPSSFSREDLLKCARGELFGQGNAQLPEPPMLMMDRITDISSDKGEPLVFRLSLSWEPYHARLSWFRWTLAVNRF